MPENFDTYGQISPMGFTQDYGNQTEQQLDNTYLNMAFNFEEQKNAVLLKKQRELDALGQQITAEHEKIADTSFVKDKSILEQGFKDGIDKLKNLYKTPGDKRDVEWYRLKDDYTKNINSEAINNDLYNKDKYKEHYEAMRSGAITVTDFYDWKSKFMQEAEQGIKTTIPDPPSAKENMYATGMQVINDATWNPAVDFEADGTTISKNSWKNMIDNRIVEAVYPSAHAKFLNLPEAERDKYYELSGDKNHEYNSEEKTRSAIKQYIYEQFEGQRYRLTEQAYQQRVLAHARSTKTEPRSLFDETVLPYLNQISPEYTDKAGVTHKEQRRTFKMLAPDLLTSTPRNMYVQNQEVSLPNGVRKGKVYVNFRIPDGQSKYLLDAEKRRKAGAKVDVGWEQNEVRANIMDEPIVLTASNMQNVIDNVNEFYDENGQPIENLTERDKIAIRQSLMLSYRDRTITDESAQYAFTGVKEPIYVIQNNISKSNSFKHITRGIYDATLTTYNKYVGDNGGMAGIDGMEVER